MKTIILTKESAEFIQKITLDLVKCVNGSLGNAYLPHELSQRLITYHDELMSFYQLIEKKLYALDKEGEEQK